MDCGYPFDAMIGETKHVQIVRTTVIIPLARRAWWSFKLAPFLLFSVSKVGLPLMGDITGFPLLFSALLHII